MADTPKPKRKPKSAAKAAVRPPATPPSGPKAKPQPKPKDGDAEGGANKTERLLDLVVLLLASHRPLSFSEIRGRFPDYDTPKADAGSRMFERDKKELLSLGIPLRHVGRGDLSDSRDDISEDAYVIDRRQYLLPPLDFTPAELGSLAVIAEVARHEAAFPYGQEIDSALRKVAFDRAPPEMPADLRVDMPSATATRELRQSLRHLETAVRLHKRVTFKYRKPSSDKKRAVESRRVDPYGLVYRQGTWLVVGHCHQRDGLRTFRVDRMTDVELAPKPGTVDFEVPPNLDLHSLASRSPWTFAIAPAIEAVLEAAPELSHMEKEDFGDGATVETLPTGGLRITFACTNPSYLVQRVLHAGGRIAVVSPPSLREKVVAVAMSMAATLRDRAKVKEEAP